MVELIFGIIIGYISAITVFCLMKNNNNNNNNKYRRSCNNCKYSTPHEGKDKNLHFYCGLAIQKDISTFPVSEDNCCGHFDYTDELKMEQVREKLKN